MEICLQIVGHSPDQSVACLGSQHFITTLTGTQGINAGLLQAFQLHREEQGMAPRSLDTLVRLGYCERADLKTAEGGTFLMKITGNQEEKVTISAIDTHGKPIAGLSVRISLN